MNLVDLELEIKNAYDNRNFKETLKKIDLYLSLNNSGVYGSLMYFYVDCLINVGRKEDAYKYINITRKFWPYIYSDGDLAELYIICDKIKEAEKILNKRTTDTKLYYTAARAYMLNGYYYESKYWFRYLMSITDDEKLIEKANGFIMEINNHLINKAFIQISYSRYKSYGKSLKPGQIIYFRGKDIVSSDSKVNYRPYLIWKVDGNKIYCFPVTTQIRREDINYILRKEKYPNYGFDRMIKENILCIDEKDVDKIIDEITPYDYDRVIDRIYKLHCYKNKMDDYGFVLEEANKLGVKKDDIIIIYDTQNQQRNFYAIESVNDSIYTAYKIEKIDDKFHIINDKLYTFTNKDFIIKINKSIKDSDNYQFIYKRKVSD